MKKQWREINKKITPLFFCTVVVPTFISILYFAVFSSNIYVSESRFVVRSPDKPAATGLGVLLKSTGFSNGGDEIYAAQDYVVSRDALRSLNQRNAFERAYGDRKISIFDRFNSTGTGGTFEDLYRYYQKKVKVDHNANSSITTLTVRAFSPKDAFLFNEKLLGMAEATVNRLNERGRNDLIHFAQAEVDEAKDQSREAALALSAFRNQQGVVDPEKQATVQLQMVSKLQDELIATQTQLRELRSGLAGASA